MNERDGKKSPERLEGNLTSQEIEKYFDSVVGDSEDDELFDFQKKKPKLDIGDDKADAIPFQSMLSSQTLSCEQKEAVIAPFTSPLCVIAPAGGGKTSTLVSRVSWWFQCHQTSSSTSSPKAVLVLTFSKKAVGEISSRLKSWMSSTLSPLIVVRTFHSLCFQILSRYDSWKARGCKSNLLSSPMSKIHLVTDRDCLSYASSAVHEMVKRGESMKSIEAVRDLQHFRPILAAIMKYKLHFHASDQNRGKTNTNSSLISRLVLAYENAKSEDVKSSSSSSSSKFALRVYDYVDLIRETVMLLQEEAEEAEEDSLVLNHLRAYFGHVFVDEFQDTNDLQFQLLCLLCPPSSSTASTTQGPCVTVVGDDDQAIYGFRGSDPSIFSKFHDSFGNSRKSILTTNFRSVPSIVTLVNDFVKVNSSRIPKTLSSGRKGEIDESLKTNDGVPTSRRNPRVQFLRFTSPEDQFSSIADSIQGVHDVCQISLNEIAVLCRIRKDLLEFNQVCKKSGIPTTFASETPMNESPESDEADSEGVESSQDEIVPSSGSRLSLTMSKKTKIKTKIRQKQKQKQKAAKDAITLSTIHSTKGLEFRVVYVISLVHGICPSIPRLSADGSVLQSSQSQQGVSSQALFAQKTRWIEEERRIAYVGLSRAKDFLIVSGYGKPMRGGGDDDEKDRNQTDFDFDEGEIDPYSTGDFDYEELKRNDKIPAKRVDADARNNKDGGDGDGPMLSSFFSELLQLNKKLSKDHPECFEVKIIDRKDVKRNHEPSNFSSRSDSNPCSGFKTAAELWTQQRKRK